MTGSSVMLSAAAMLVALPVIVDLGQAPAGTIDEFEVEARNLSCEAPQDFRFVPSGLPWLKLVNGDRVRGVKRGTAQFFVARIDLSGMKPGRYTGRLEVLCETCAPIVCTNCSATLLRTCRIDVPQMTISVDVTGAGAGRTSGGATPAVSASQAP